MFGLLFQNSEDYYILREQFIFQIYQGMGTASSGNYIGHQKCQALSSYTQEDIRVLQWRSNPQFNQFIPKVIFQYQETKKAGTFMNHCHLNQNVPLGVQYQKFIGNLEILVGKLSFEEALFALKSLLSGQQVLLNYFGKTVVSPNFCFLSKQGEVKTWVNEDYRRNTFSTRLSIVDTSSKQTEKLFLKPEDWIDQNKSSSSEANIIQKVLFLVSRLTFQQKKFNSFHHCLDNFITENILKNFNFGRVKKFVNKYIYQKKIFLKSNLFEVVERLYYQNLKEKEVESDRQSVFFKESHIERKPSHMGTIRQEKDQKSFEVSPKQLRNQISPEKRSFIQEPMQTKNSQFFNSTAHTNTNASSKFMQNAQNSYFKDGPVYGSYCMSHISGPHFPDSVQTRSNFSKNHISPQYCMNFARVTEKLMESHKRPNSLTPSQKSSINLSKASNSVIHQRKQTYPEERPQTVTKVRQKQLKTSILDNNQSNHILVGLSFGKRTNQVTPQQTKTNFVEANKTSCISIALKPQSNPHCFQTKTFKLLRSNFENSNKENNKSAVVSQGMNTSNERNSFIDNENSSQNHNFFTMKTITRLISSNQKISDQQHSEGDFPSIKNESIYSGILASMGRSVQIINAPQKEKYVFPVRRSKKLKTIYSDKE